MRPRWPYDMRPSVPAEKYIRDASGAEKTSPMSTITGRTDKRTDRRTDRQSATQYAAPPREEGRIIISNAPGLRRLPVIRSDVGAMSDSDGGDQQMLITVSTNFQNFIDVPFISTCGRYPVHDSFPLSSSSSFAFNGDRPIAPPRQKPPWFW